MGLTKGAIDITICFRMLQNTDRICLLSIKWICFLALTRLMLPRLQIRIRQITTWHYNIFWNEIKQTDITFSFSSTLNGKNLDPLHK